jgi:membrane-associated phospholipid phosphatase
MLVDSRRGLLVSGCLLAGAAAVTVLHVLPVTRAAVQGVDDPVWRFAGAIRKEPTTAVAIALSWLGSTLVNWPLRVPTLLLLAWRRHWLRLAAFGLAPSGHAIASAVTAVGLVLVLAPPGRRRWRWEVNAVIFTSVMALSRVYLRALAVGHRGRRCSWPSAAGS